MRSPPTQVSGWPLSGARRFSKELTVKLEIPLLPADDQVPTDREREVLREVGDGNPNIEIAKRLHLAEGTVRNYLSSAIVKLGARSRTEAFAKA
jgi:two-component system response regulator DesR